MNRNKNLAKRPYCPYCHLEIPSNSSDCKNCGKYFPWNDLAERFDNQLKERETSRVRAAHTLAVEIIKSVKNGNPISTHAIKGFITAWVFPKTVIVLGSIVASAVLILQTYIISRQTDFIEKQTISSQFQAEAAQFERVDYLRARAKLYRENEIRILERRPSWGHAVDMMKIGCDERCRSVPLRKALYMSWLYKYHPTRFENSPSAHFSKIFVETESNLKDEHYGPYLAKSIDISTMALECLSQPDEIKQYNLAISNTSTLIGLLLFVYDAKKESLNTAMLSSNYWTNETLLKFSPSPQRTDGDNYSRIDNNLTVGLYIDLMETNVSKFIQLQDNFRKNCSKLADTAAAALTNIENRLILQTSLDANDK